MNERIKELAKQAGMESPDFPYDEFGMPSEQKKFAELIVRECAEIVCGYFNERTFYQVSQCYAGGTLPLSISFAIKRHFGIEN
jgi:hypothetical protein